MGKGPYMKEIADLISIGDYEKAQALLEELIKAKGYDDTAAVLDAAIMGEYYGDREGMWKAIQKGLLYNCRNYELYIMLGNYYLAENQDQSYLCYENAWFHCDDDEDKRAIAEMLNQFKGQYKVSVEKVSIVILSYDLLEYTKACIESIRKTTPECAREIVVVDNGSKDGSVEWLRGQADVILIENTINRGFPGGCNQGIKASSQKSDIFLLNNDTMLPENALFWLRMGLYGREKNGAAGSVSNCAGGQVAVSGIDNVPDMIQFGERTNVPMEHPYENRLFLVGFALLVKRTVMNQVGLLDEVFFPGNNEDVDLGLRILKAGYQNVLCKNSFILHFGSKTFDKDREGYYAAASRNRNQINKKWGFDVDYYLHPREDLVKWIQEPSGRAMHILDVGCGCGASMGYLKGIYPNAKVYGTEPVPKAAELASHMGQALCGDVENMDFPWEEEYFDYIIVGDALEHWMEPENVLKRLGRHLKKEGHIIASLSNLKHYSVILPLLKWDMFPYSNAGILDKAHVKMYTGVEIQRLMARSGYEVEQLDGTKAGEPNEQEDHLLDGLQRVLGMPTKETFLVYQYIFKAKKSL